MDFKHDNCWSWLSFFQLEKTSARNMEKKLVRIDEGWRMGWGMEDGDTIR